MLNNKQSKTSVRVTLNNMLAIICLGICLSMLSGCSLFKPITIEPLHYYTITATPPACCDTSYRKKITILVTLPRANAIYSNPRMLYSPDCNQLQYFIQSRWADSPPKLLHPLIIKSLQNTGCFNAIINTTRITPYNYILNTQILCFQQEFFTPCNQFRLGIRAQLIDAHCNCIIATKDFMAVQRTRIANPQGGVEAANCATRRILRKIMRFTLCHTN